MKDTQPTYHTRFEATILDKEGVKRIEVPRDSLFTDEYGGLMAIDNSVLLPGELVNLEMVLERDESK